jgi:hypothetical protein
MLRTFCVVLYMLFACAGCNQWFGLDEIAPLPDSTSVDAPVDALVATGLHCEFPDSANGICEGVPRQVRCTAAAATSCTLTVPGAIPAMFGPVSADANGSVTIDQQISLPVGLTTLVFTCMGDVGTSNASFNLPVRAARLTVPAAPVAVGQNMTVSFFAPDVVESNAVPPCSMSIGSITNLYAAGMASNTFSWNVAGALEIVMECRDSANQPMYMCGKHILVQ